MQVFHIDTSGNYGKKVLNEKEVRKWLTNCNEGKIENAPRVINLGSSKRYALLLAPQCNLNRDYNDIATILFESGNVLKGRAIIMEYNKEVNKLRPLEARDIDLLKIQCDRIKASLDEAKERAVWV